MSDRDQPKAAQKAGASLMRRVDVAGGAGSSPRRLAESGGTADCRHFSIQLTALTGIGGYAFFL